MIRIVYDRDKKNEDIGGMKVKKDKKLLPAGKEGNVGTDWYVAYLYDRNCCYIHKLPKCRDS